MKITFLGTRGGIIPRSKLHYRHSVALITHAGTTIQIDYGLDWLGTVIHKNVRAIFITHAHPDHAQGLMHGTALPVYATQDSWDVMHSYAIASQYKNCIADQEIITLGALQIQAFSVQHSLRAPAVGYRITGGAITIFYVPDLVSIYDVDHALRNVHCYIGDGARITRPLLREHDGYVMGHTSIAEQLRWCVQYGVPRAIFTHCGSEIVRADAAVMQEKVAMLGRDCGVRSRIAYDGLSVLVR